jgi:hypothetical protein
MMFRAAPNPNQTLTVNKVKPFAWSYSRIKNYETCPRRYEAIDVNKEFKQDETDQLDEGQRLHKAMAKRIMSDVALPREFYYMEKHAENLAKVTHTLQIVNCELKLAINKDYQATGFFERGVWARCMIDYIKIVPKNEKQSFAHIVDYKTGKLQDDDAQLAVNAMLTFSCFKDVVGIKSEFLWTKYNDTRSIVFTRSNIMDIWGTLIPRIDRLAQAHADNDFPAKPGKLCREYCSVDTCEHCGVGR